MASTRIMKIRLLMTLPKYSAERSTGASSSPSRHPRSFSIAMERLRPRVPANAKVTHRTPAVTDWRIRRSSSSAKLKIKIVRIAKTSMLPNSSRLRSSAAMSFQTTAPMARK